MAPTIRPEPVEVLLFDLEGVVIDIDFGRCMTRWAEAAGREVADVAARFTFDAAYEDHERGRLAVDAYCAGLRRMLGVDLDDEQLLEGWNDIYVGVDAEVIELLRDAQDHFRLIAFTNTNPTHHAVWSTRFAADLEVFSAVYSSFEIGRRKPDRAAFEHVASLIGTAPTRILFFDDSPENVAGAIDAGMQAAHVTSAASVRHALALAKASGARPGQSPRSSPSSHRGTLGR